MVGKVKKDQLLWTIDVDYDSVVHGHVAKYEKKGLFDDTPRIRLMLGDTPVDTIYKRNLSYTMIMGPADGFFLTRQEAIRALIHHKEEEIDKINEGLDVLLYELYRKSKKDVKLSRVEVD
jgi:hypothetical protein